MSQEMQERVDEARPVGVASPVRAFVWSLVALFGMGVSTLVLGFWPSGPNPTYVVGEGHRQDGIFADLGSDLPGIGDKVDNEEILPSGFRVSSHGTRYAFFPVAKGVLMVHMVYVAHKSDCAQEQIGPLTDAKLVYWASQRDRRGWFAIEADKFYGDWPAAADVEDPMFACFIADFPGDHSHRHAYLFGGM